MAKMGPRDGKRGSIGGEQYEEAEQSEQHGGC